MISTPKSMANWRIQTHQKAARCLLALRAVTRCTPRWLLPDILVPLVTSRAILVGVAWFGFHFLHFQVKSNKWEVASDGMVHNIAGRLSPNAHPFVNMWARW